MPRLTPAQRRQIADSYRHEHLDLPDGRHLWWTVHRYPTGERIITFGAGEETWDSTAGRDLLADLGHPDGELHCDLEHMPGGRYNPWKNPGW